MQLHIFRSKYNELVELFLDICKQINFPVSLEKTEWANSVMVFLGMLLNTVSQTISIPVDKVAKAMDLIMDILSHRKTTVKKIQSLTGLLNFLCRCVVPGRAFTRCLYAHYSPSMLPHHHVRVNREMKNDLFVWLQFLNNPVVYCRPFIDFTEMLIATDLEWSSGASGAIGFGGVHKNEWFAGTWAPEFLQEKPSIEYLELYGVTVSIFLWAEFYKNKRICLFCDNQAVVAMINNSSSSCKRCMVLVRMITLRSLEFIMRIFAKYIKTSDNYFSDALSRGQMTQFWSLADEQGKTFDRQLRGIPCELTPILGKLWK